MALPHVAIIPGAAPLLWSNVQEAFDKVNDNFTALDLATGGTAVDLTDLGTALIPRTTELHDLGSVSKKWRDLYLSGSSLYLGDAVISATGTTVNLPIGSTIGGLRVDENYFKFIAVSGQSTIEADEGTDTLTMAAGNAGITIATNASTDTLTFTNTGVVSAISGTGIAVSAATGSVTFTNTGVTSLVAGQGIDLSASTGSVTLTNSGLIGIDPGLGITVSPRDPITGLVTVTNNQPNIPQNVFSTIVVPTQSDVAADSTTDTLTIQTSGDGLSITTNSSTDTITFANTGVHSLAVGNGLTASAGTGAINLILDATLSRNIIGDIIGSVFGDDSSILVDATDNRVLASGGFFGNVTGNVIGNANSATVSSTLDITDTNGLTTVYYPTFVENRTTGQTVRADVDLTYRTDTNTLTAPAFSGNLTGTVTGNIFTNLIDSADSSAITVTPVTIFSSDVTVENDLTVVERLTVKGSRVINLTELKSVVAVSVDFADFQSRIAALV